LDQETVFFPVSVSVSVVDCDDAMAKLGGAQPVLLRPVVFIPREMDPEGRMSEFAEIGEALEDEHFHGRGDEWWWW
jgi:hypothetical protein